MSYETVHTIGYTSYFILALLFLWMGQIPRTNSGSGWWALALSFSLLARLSLYLLLPDGDRPVATTVYALINVVEKPFLLTGLARFLNVPFRMRPWWIALAVTELWIMFAWQTNLPPLVCMAGYSLFNAGAMFAMARLAWQARTELPRWPLRVTAIASLLMGLHWLSSSVAIHAFPSWFRNGFMLGTVLMTVQYLSLLIAVLTLFQMRLLEAEAKALDMALLDPLTGLNNKRYMSRLFDHALLLATRPHHLVAVFFIDLDNFKQINDTAGHAAGDEVLKVVASRLRSSTRSTDICARIGGDEFIVIGTQLDNEAQACEVANKLLSQLRDEIPFNGHSHAVGASIGVSLFPRDGTDLAALIARADEAMYGIKNNGKGGFKLYQQEAAAS
ncbi:diguanylate cyclase (GGDEF)-like protein [Herbaspirillum sp. Sphag1AN]|uniref:GGDEF domain-containing protein n=1 Tax=unclassified Herbaspirillum TaxID=2624150 RepID=UPI0016186F63|nr:MULTISPECIES: GGDEF domain-containing protein [unclassified Herbaspirillum]MBB3211758.1 diguanylate cyclase (GGDEF)-like protein [Herbaspirillum sp. Sphag1AN]MBB3244974.1 diguanylate cyclase (GGDEF)-like protein [Herbaspirillum sp. Sphag64]